MAMDWGRTRQRARVHQHALGSHRGVEARASAMPARDRRADRSSWGAWSACPCVVPASWCWLCSLPRSPCASSPAAQVLRPPLDGQAAGLQRSLPHRTAPALPNPRRPTRGRADADRSPPGSAGSRRSSARRPGVAWATMSWVPRPRTRPCPATPSRRGRREHGPTTVAAQWPAQSTSGKCARSGRERPSLRVILEAQGQSSAGIAVGGARLLRAWTNGPIRDAAASLGIGKRWPLVQVSQSTERRFCNPQVVGSSPTLGSNMPCVGPDLNDH